jgi:hypothetical protein
MSTKKSSLAMPQSRLVVSRTLTPTVASHYGDELTARHAGKMFKPKFQFTRNKSDSSFVLGYN